jgi:hypothetical protein
VSFRGNESASLSSKFISKVKFPPAVQKKVFFCEIKSKAESASWQGSELVELWEEFQFKNFKLFISNFEKESLVLNLKV